MYIHYLFMLIHGSCVLLLHMRPHGSLMVAPSKVAKPETHTVCTATGARDDELVTFFHLRA